MSNTGRDVFSNMQGDVCTVLTPTRSHLFPVPLDLSRTRMWQHNSSCEPTGGWSNLSNQNLSKGNVGNFRQFPLQSGECHPLFCFADRSADAVNNNDNNFYIALSSDRH